jgi:hypothetical protein
MFPIEAREDITRSSGSGVWPNIYARIWLRKLEISGRRKGWTGRQLRRADDRIERIHTYGISRRDQNPTDQAAEPRKEDDDGSLQQRETSSSSFFLPLNPNDETERTLGSLLYLL